ncbi:MAG: site-2 protease family protein [Oscillospiraceae bacterium]|nr:site-2 protease family protein [Oscillospiraceae bacterium]
MLRWGKLEISWGFPVLAAMALLAGTGEALPAAVLSALAHETGHLLALGLAGARVERIRLTAFGAEIQADTRYLPYPREILCTLAGPAVNLALAVVFARLLGDDLAAGVNLVLGVFNLLPVPALDGGRILHLLVSWGWDPMAADQVCRWVGLGCALALTAAALAVTVRYHAGIFLLTGAAGTLLPQIRRDPPAVR